MDILKIKTLCCKARVGVRVITPIQAENFCIVCKKVLDIKALVRSEKGGKL